MLVVGIAGGVASGKSLVARCFQHFGAEVLDGDRIGHEVLQEPEVIQQIVHRWGDGILDDGQISRPRLGRIVFGPPPDGPEALKHLERITHQRIGEEIQRRLDLARHDPSRQACVLDAALMFKVGWDQMCDRIVFVDTPLKIRIQRSRQRGWTAVEVEKREANQTSVLEKKSKSTDVIDSSKSKDATYRQAADLWRGWGLQLPVELFEPSTLFD
jgi:dephospho-CoA kinase